MIVLARSLLGQSGFFLHALPSSEWYSSKNEDIGVPSLLLLIYYYVLSLIHYFDQNEIHKTFVNLICFLIFLEMVVEIFQDNFFLPKLPNDIFQDLMKALHPQSSPQFFMMLLFY